MPKFEIVSFADDGDAWNEAVDLAVECHLLSIYESLDDVPEDDLTAKPATAEMVSAMLCCAEIYFAVVEGKKIGLAAGVAPNGGCGHLYFLYVRKEYRHAGIGTALLRTLEIYFAQHGCHRIKTSLSSADVEELHFLKKRGYEQMHIALRKSLATGLYEE